MKILHIINNLQGGGAEKLLSELLPIQNSDHNVFLLLLNNRNPKFYDKVKQDGINNCVLTDHKPLPYKLLKIRNFIKNNGIEIIHVHLFPSLYYTAFATLGMNIPLIFTEHSTSNKRRKYRPLKYLERVVYSRYSAVICISEQTKISLKNHLKFNSIENKLVHIPNGIKLLSGKEVPERIFPQNIIKIIMVGRFELQKDHSTVIRALQMLNKNIHLYFAGTGSLEEKYKKEVREGNLAGRVHFLGFVNDIQNLLLTMDIAVLSSNWEGFGLSAVESMALGIPTIGSNVPGLAEVLQNGGLVFEKGNEKELAKLIKKLITNREFFYEVSKEGREKAGLYDIYKMNQEYLKTYEKTKENSYTS